MWVILCRRAKVGDSSAAGVGGAFDVAWHLEDTTLRVRGGYCFVINLLT